MTISSKSSERIKAIGFVCALMVVAIHCAAIPKEWWNGTLDMPRWVVALQTLGADTLARLAVPWFFVVSGFFLVKGLKFDEGHRYNALFAWWMQCLLKRLLTLGIPYLLWNLIYYVFKLATGKYGFDVTHCLIQLTGLDIYDAPACGQFWYVRCLLVYVVCAPLFIMAFGHRRIGVLAIIGLLICWFAGVGLPIRYMQLTDWSYILFFGTGIYLGLGNMAGVHFDKRLGILSVALLVSSVAGVLSGAVSRNATLAHICGKLMIVTGLPALWFVGDSIVSATSRWKQLYSLAFFVYAMHVIFVSVTHKVTERLLPPDLYESVGYLLKITIGIVGSLGIGCLLNRFSLRVLRVLCGGRG